MATADESETDSEVKLDRPLWRQLNRHLWVGHNGTASLGTIEHGARYVYIDPDGIAHPGTRTLSEAQDAATGPIPVQVSRKSPSAARARLTRRGRLIVFLVGSLVIVAAFWMVGEALLR